MALSDEIIGVAVAILMAGLLLPIGLAQWLTYTPSNGTIATIYIVGAILAVLGLAMRFMPKRG